MPKLCLDGVGVTGHFRRLASKRGLLSARIEILIALAVEKLLVGAERRHPALISSRSPLRMPGLAARATTCDLDGRSARSILRSATHPIRTRFSLGFLR